MASQARQPHKRLVLLFYKLAELERRLNQIVIGQPRYVRALLVGLATREHVALISPPGTAKSYLVRKLAKAIDGAEFYMTLLNPYITYDELFGPLDIKSLVGAEQGGAVRRRWSKLVKSHFAFLDEGFKANPALLNSLLSLLNERLVYDPFTGTEIHTPLIMAVVASNEVPSDESLRALWDRIVIRVYSTYPTEPEVVGEIVETYWRKTVPIEKFMHVKEVIELNRLVEDTLRDPQLGSIIAIFLTGGVLGDTLAMYRYMVMYPLLKLHTNGVVEVSTRTLTQKLPKIYLAEVMLNKMAGMPEPLAHYHALMNIVRYLAPDPDSLEGIEQQARQMFERIQPVLKKIESAWKLIREAAKKQGEERRQLLEQAKTELREVASLPPLSIPIVEDKIAELEKELNRMGYRVDEYTAPAVALLYAMAWMYANNKLKEVEKLFASTALPAAAAAPPRSKQTSGERRVPA